MTRDWTRIFPDADHRWIMALRQEDSIAEFFAPADPTGAMLAERQQWLADPEKYADLLPEAEPAVRESVDLARSLGATIDENLSAYEQLLALGRLWEPDFVLMHPGSDGVYRMAGGVVCFPSSWAMRAKMSHPIREIHEIVPGLNAALGRSIDTFLTKQVPGVPWRRENWSLSRDAALNQHPTRPRRPLDATITVEEVWIRLEHQLLLKLPHSGSVFFGIRIDVVPLATVVADPIAASRFARILTTISTAAADYKNISPARDALLTLLKVA